jgi:5,10-methylenetetrahydromethanopterin reductase
VDFGVTFPSRVDSWKLVQRAEAAGFSHAWFYDSQMLYSDLFVSMTLAAANTKRIRLGTAVLVPTNRIAPVTAGALASLNVLAPGRLDLGVGTGFTARNTMGQKAMRMADMREYLRVVRGLLAGETVLWESEGAAHPVRFLHAREGYVDLEAPPIPIHVSAFGPRGRALAAGMAQGWITFTFHTGGAARQATAVDAACRAVGRAPASLYRTVMTIGCVQREGESLESERVVTQAGPAAVLTYHNLMDTGGPGPSWLAAETAGYRAMYERYTPAEARYLSLHVGHFAFVRDDERPFVTPELIRRATFTGTREELRDRVRELAAAGYDQVTFHISPGQEDAVGDWARVAEIA